MLGSHLTLGRRWTFVGGKGGVGKTTVAAALAVERARQGEDVIVLSVDPAHSLGDALGIDLGHEPAPVPPFERLLALEVDASYERVRFLAEHGPSISALFERGTYLDAEDVREIEGRTVPGLDELAAFLRLARLSADDRPRVIVDTPPTGHALRLFELPALAQGWADALEAMEARARAVSIGLAGGYRPDSAARFVAWLRDEVSRVANLLRDPEATRMVLVTTSERVVIAETLRYQEDLERLRIAIGGAVVNRLRHAPARGALGPRIVYVPDLPDDPHGIPGLERFSAAARAAADPTSGAPSEPPPGGPSRTGLDPRGTAPEEPSTAVDHGKAMAEAARRGSQMVDGPFALPDDRLVYLVGGKGGVGKTSTAAAVAVRQARNGRRVLLLSVDPAGSLSDLLEVPVAREPVPVPSVPALEARQLDAVARWADFRAAYREHVDRLFTAIVGGGVSASLDREVVDRLIDLAPPGIDELVALMEVIDLTEVPRYDALVVDTAPTGHLLRLLEMPGLALEWCHTLMRLLLKYRGVVPLGDVAEEVLGLARSIRTFRALLEDASRSWFLVVALPEALSVPETERLLRRLHDVSIRPAAMLINRALDASGGKVRGEVADRVGDLLAIAGELPVAGAPLVSPPPSGVAGLEGFAAAWRLIEPESVVL